MKKLIIILTLFLLFLNSVQAGTVKAVTKDYKVLTKDKFTIAATLKYPKIKAKNEFQTVVLLHSLGYSSEWWQTLPDELLEKGYAVILIDLRGHGRSVYNSKLVRTSWKSLKNNAYAKYPDDIITMLDYIKSENKRIFFKQWAFVGSDIGGSTAIHVANKIAYKPKTIVLLSPVINAKGLFTPVKLAELNNIDILSIVGSTDKTGKNTNSYLEKFAQSTYTEYVSTSNSNGMILLKNDENVIPLISSWIEEYLKK